jgi:predicted nucleic acid-binding protein
LIQLDTCYLIRALVAGSKEDAGLREWIRNGETPAISTVAWAEFLCGPLGPDDPSLAEKIIKQRLPFDSECAELAGAPLATTNKRDFRRYEEHGLELI